MFQTEHHSFLSNIRKNRHPTKIKGQCLEDIAKAPPGIPNTTLSKLIRINHRRNLQNDEEKKSTIPAWKKRAINPSPFKERHSEMTQKQHQSSSAERGIRTGYRPLSFRGDDSSAIVKFPPSKKKIGPRFKSMLHKDQTETEEKQQPNQKKLVLKLANRLNISPSKDSDPQHSVKKFKKISMFNKTAINFDYRPEDEDSFVSLISKFRFQNLKSEGESSLPFKIKFDQYQTAEIPPNHSQEQYFSTTPSRQTRCCKNKMTKTMFKMSWKGDPSSRKISRKVSILSPWESDVKDMGSTNQLLRAAQ